MATCAVVAAAVKLGQGRLSEWRSRWAGEGCAGSRGARGRVRATAAGTKVEWRARRAQNEVLARLLRRETKVCDADEGEGGLFSRRLNGCEREAGGRSRAPLSAPLLDPRPHDSTRGPKAGKPFLLFSCPWAEHPIVAGTRGNGSRHSVEELRKLSDRRLKLDRTLTS